jgi:hypothetical protein
VLELESQAKAFEEIEVIEVERGGGVGESDIVLVKESQLEEEQFGAEQLSVFGEVEVRRDGLTKR